MAHRAGAGGGRMALLPALFPARREMGSFLKIPLMVRVERRMPPLPAKEGDLPDSVSGGIRLV